MSATVAVNHLNLGHLPRTTDLPRFMPHHRRFRFSTRTLLILVAMVAVYFGSWPWCKEWVHRRVQIRSNYDRAGLIVNEGGPSIPFVVCVDSRHA